MECANCLSDIRGGREPSGEPASVRIWCPTWIGARRGPICCCPTHARNFQAEHNPNAANGQFFFGEEADKMFATIVVVVQGDPYFGPAKRALADGDSLGFGRHIVEHEGRIWIEDPPVLLCLGFLDDVREKMPKLLETK